MESVCPQCDRRNPWEKLYCSYCGICLKGAEVVQQEKKTHSVGRLRAGGVWFLVLLALLLSLSGMAALLGRFLL